MPGQKSTRLTHALTAIAQHLSLTGYDQLGLPALRDAIAARYTARGFRPG
jgi:aspartate/methionine/tyrosine aminotransferase